MDAIHQATSREDLMRVLEGLSGRSIRSRADVQNVIARLGGTSAAQRRSSRWKLARRTILAVGLLLSFLQYYLIDVRVQIMSLPSITFLALPGNAP